MKNIFIITFVFYYSISFGQNSTNFHYRYDSAYYNQGVIAFQKNEIKKADSLFTKSILARPSRDAYFNRALTRLVLNDSCSACINLELAGEMYADSQALNLYNGICLRKFDTIYYDKKYKKVNKTTNYMYYEECKTLKYDSVTIGIIHKKKHNSTMQFKFSDIAHPKTVNVYASYVMIDSIKYFDYIYSSTFNEDNKETIEKFKNRLKVYINTKYQLDKKPLRRKFFTAIVNVNSNGKVINANLLSNPFETLDKSTCDSLKLDILNSIKSMPILIPSKLFGNCVGTKFLLTIEF